MLQKWRIPEYHLLFPYLQTLLCSPLEGHMMGWTERGSQVGCSPGCHYQLGDLRQWLGSEPLSAPLPGCGKDWTTQAELMGRMLRKVVSLLCSKALSLLCFESPNLIHPVFRHFNQPPLFWVHCHPLRHWTHPEASFEPAQWKYSFPGKISIPRTGF